jgi:NAD(P)H dehydrogenase (quinone)
MKVLWVFAHPEQESLNAALRDEGLRALTEAGHEWRLSDLYEMGWKATVDRQDFNLSGARVGVSQASMRAHRCGTLSADIRVEQDKLDWADTVVLQFPLWWYSMPAILKGWFDRVFVKGYAYGVRDPSAAGRTLRYGEGRLAGKRAQVIVTTGSPSAALGPRGINGQLDQILFPLLHGTLWYAGIAALPPVAIYGADHLDPDQYEEAVALIRQSARSLEVVAPINYRYQNRGDYDDNLVLRPEHTPGQTGIAVHSMST